MAVSLADILYALQNGVSAINNLNTNLVTLFPPITAPTSVAPTAGAITYTSSRVAAFATVQTSSGGTYKIALLPSS